MTKNQIPPQNYRKHLLKISDCPVMIAAMASPDKGTAGQDSVMEYIKHQAGFKKPLIIGLKEESFHDLATKHGIEYIHFPIVDFSKAPPESYDQIYRYVTEATLNDRPVTIHCGAGDGRSGTTIASLKLREIIEKQAKIDPSILDKPTVLSTYVTASESHDKVKCSTYVKTAIESIRNLRITPPDSSSNGANSVENAIDIQALQDYEFFVKNMLKLSNTNLMDLSLINLLYALPSLPTERYEQIIEALQNEWPNHIKDSKEFSLAINKIRPEHRAQVFDGFKDQWPSIIRSGDDFLNVMRALTPEQQTQVFDAFKDQWPSIIHSGADFSNVMIYLVPEQRKLVFDAFKNQWPTIIHTEKDFSDVIPYLPPEQYVRLLNVFKDKWLDIIHSSQDFNNIIELLPLRNRNEFIDVIKHHWLKIIHTSNDFSVIMLWLSVEQRTQAIEACKNELPKIIKTAFAFNHNMSYLAPEARSLIYDAMKDKITDIVYSMSDFRLVMGFLSQEQRAHIFGELKTRLPEMTKSTADIIDILTLLTPEQGKQYIESLQNRWPKFIYSAKDFDNLMNKIPEDSCPHILQQIQEHLPNIIHKTQDFAAVAQHLSPEQKIQLIDGMKNRWPKIYSLKELRNLMVLIPSEQQITFLEGIKNHVPKMINTTNDFIIIMKTIAKTGNPKYIGIFMDELKANLPGLIRTADDFSNLINSFTTELQKLMVNQLNTHLESLFKTAGDLEQIKIPPETQRLLTTNLILNHIHQSKSNNSFKQTIQNLSNTHDGIWGNKEIHHSIEQLNNAIHRLSTYCNSPVIEKFIAAIISKNPELIDKSIKDLLQSAPIPKRSFFSCISQQIDPKQEIMAITQGVLSSFIPTDLSPQKLVPVADIQLESNIKKATQ
jgi:hypothetical protein